jgi:hypothetical protein
MESKERVISCRVCGRPLDLDVDDDAHSLSFIIEGAWACRYCVGPFKDGYQLARKFTDSVNIMSSESAVGQGFAEAMVRSHPTLQQSVFRSLVTFFRLYGDMVRTDARNEDSAELAKKWFSAAGGHTLRFI